MRQDDLSHLSTRGEKPPVDRSLRRSSFQCHSLYWTVGIVVLVGLVAFIMTVHRFLAVSSPAGQGILVVEAWIPSQSLREAARIFQSGSYRYLVVVGSQINPSDNSLNYADRAADDLERLGLAKDRVVRIATPYRSINRTFATAKAFKQWVLSSAAGTCCIDVYTVGVHARKSWITFRAVLGNTYQVGVIAGPETSYNPKYWLMSRRGLWLVARNLSGYLYTRYEIAVRAASE
jgi:hypothetical protein